MIWRELLDKALSAHQDIPQAKFVQVATVKPDKSPANRTLNFRCFLEPEQSLVFTMDIRSEKVSHIKENPAVEACWYFFKTREQFRLSGQAEIVSKTNDPRIKSIMELTWRERTDESRQSFTWPTPGGKRAAEDVFQLPIPVSMVDTFALLIVRVDVVDYLNVRDFPYTRVLFKRSNDWTSEGINP